MAPIFLDMVYNIEKGAIAWEVIYKMLEDECLKVTITKATANSIKP